MSFVAVAIGGAALVGAGATAYAASSSASAQADANKANLKAADANNQLNYQLFQESRGSTGSALLPTYFPSGTERELAERARESYEVGVKERGTPEEEYARYKAIAEGAMPAADAGGALVNQLFSGELERQQQANIAPVLAARGAVAGSNRRAILQGLVARLTAISADRARAGYAGGGSTSERARLTQATIPALQQAATVGAQADLANATDVANVKNNAITTRLSNINLPLTQAANRAQLESLPATATGAANSAALSTFDWFKMNPQAFQAQRAPLVTPVANTGQIVGQAIGSTANAVGNYFANRALASQYSQIGSGAGTGLTLDTYIPYTNPNASYFN